MLHHRYIRYSNAKSDPLSSAALFLGLAPPTLFSIHHVKMRIKKKKYPCVRERVQLLVSLSFALLHTLCVFMCQCVFASSEGLVSVCHDCIPTWGIGLSAVLIQARLKKKKKRDEEEEEEEREEEDGACCF